MQIIYSITVSPNDIVAIFAMIGSTLSISVAAFRFISRYQIIDSDTESVIYSMKLTSPELKSGGSKFISSTRAIRRVLAQSLGVHSQAIDVYKPINDKEGIEITFSVTSARSLCCLFFFLYLSISSSFLFIY